MECVIHYHRKLETLFMRTAENMQNIARITSHNNRIILFFLEFVGVDLEKINFLLRNFISLQRNQSVLIARPRRDARITREIENWPHYSVNVISRNYCINLVTCNNTRDNITKTIREHSIHQARTIAALAGSNDFLANCFLVLLFRLLFLSPFFSFSLSLSLYHRPAILFFPVLLLLP